MVFTHISLVNTATLHFPMLSHQVLNFVCFCFVSLSLHLFSEIVFVGEVEKLFTTASPLESSDIYDSSSEGIYTLYIGFSHYHFCFSFFYLRDYIL